MIARTFQWVGVVAVIGLIGVSVLALTVVKDRVQVVVTDAKTAGEPDPLALVKDDLRQIHTDLDAVTNAMRTNLEKIGERLADHAAVHAELREGVAATRAQLGKWQPADAMRRLDQRLAALDRRVEGLQRDVRAAAQRHTEAATAPRRPSAGSKAGRLPVAQQSKQRDPAQPGSEVPTVARDVEKPAPAAPVKKRRRGFLAFDLPARGFRFAGRQEFRILPSLSRVGFDAKSTLHDFTGVTSKIAGQFVADLANGKSKWQGEVECQAAALRTGVDGRDAGLREHLLTAKHPKIRFTITGFRASKIDAARQKSAGTVTGRMSIRGKERAFEMPVEISVDASRRIVVEGQATLKLTDYGVPVPSQVGVITMEDEVKVWIALRARSTGGSKG